MKPVVVLRPEPGNTATVRSAEELGLRARSVPLFTIQSLPWAAPDPMRFDALIITSANAVRCAGEQLGLYARLPVHAVGAATAAACCVAGLQVTAVGSEGIDALLASLPKDRSLLHLCGDERREPAVRSSRITAVPVYAAPPVPDPDLSACRGAVVLVHSPRAGKRLAELMPERSATSVAAISAASASACGLGWQELRVADRPNDAAVLSLAHRMCQLLPSE